MTRNLSYLKRLASILKEADEEADEKPVEKEEGNDSLDSQVDNYLSTYENEAKKTKNEGRDFRLLTRRFLLEAEDEDPFDMGDEEEGSDDTGEEPQQKGTPDTIDITSFADSVMRLVDNSDHLLEMQNTILRRAANFLKKSYDDETIEEFKAHLRDARGIEIGKSPQDVADEQFSAPNAAAAGPGGGGGGGA